MGARSKRLLVICLTVVVVAIVSTVLYSAKVMNPRVIEELTADPNGERAKKVMLLTFPDDKTLPVNYLHEGDHVYAGADFGWWKSFQGDGAPVTLLIKGETLHGHATVILDDPTFTETIFSRLRPTVPKWLPRWLNGKLVVIALDSTAGN